MHAAVLSIALVPLALTFCFFVVLQVVTSVLWLLSATANVGRVLPEEIFIPALEALIVGLLVRFAYVNHRSAERTTRQVLQQLLVILLCLVVGSVVVAGTLIGLARL
jgi:hypothetical protein